MEADSLNWWCHDCLSYFHQRVRLFEERIRAQSLKKHAAAVVCVNVHSVSHLYLYTRRHVAPQSNANYRLTPHRSSTRGATRSGAKLQTLDRLFIRHQRSEPTEKQRGRESNGERASAIRSERERGRYVFERSFEVAISSVLIDNSPWLTRCWLAFEPRELENGIVWWFPKDGRETVRGGAAGVMSSAVRP